MQGGFLGALLEREHRIEQLMTVFGAFDLDGSGEIDSHELVRLENARRKRQKGGKCSDEKNARLMEKMVVNRDGTVSFKVSKPKFVQFFDELLPDVDEEFHGIIAEFMLVAEARKARRGETKFASLQRTAPLESDELRRAHERKLARWKLLGGPPAGDRQSALQAIYREFDIDGDGQVGGAELLLLGRMQRRPGHKDGEWTVEMDDRLLRRMGVSRNGNMSKRNFVQHFDSSLPTDSTDFKQIVKRFMECAQTCRKKKMQLRESLQQKKAAEQAAQRRSRVAAKSAVLNEAAKGRLFAQRMEELDAELEG